MSISVKYYSYEQLAHMDFSENDLLGIGSFMSPNVISAYTSNPSISDKNEIALLLAEESGVIKGRYILYKVRICCKGKVVSAYAPGSIEVHESQRGKGIGTLLNDKALSIIKDGLFLFSFISPSYHRMLSKARYNCTIFNFPEFHKVIDISNALEVRGVTGILLKAFSVIGNSLLYILNIPSRIRVRSLKKRYVIKKEDTVPEWAGEMCLNDGHDFLEFHDTEWLQWNLMHKLSGKQEDKQSFFSIQTMDGKPVGFFLTKERLRENIGKCKRMLCGVLGEWASVDSNLTEADINLLAYETFSKSCYYMKTVTDNPSTIKKLKTYAFVRCGSMQMGFRTVGDLDPDMRNQSAWRIRFGCCNSIIF